MSYITRLLSSLHKLQSGDFTSEESARLTKYMVDNVLSLIYVIGRENLTFNEQEKVEIENLLVKALNPIKFNIEWTVTDFRKKLDPELLIKRSALQFLFDNFSNTLKRALEDAKIGESIKSLDEVISIWSDVSCSDSD